MNQTTIFDMMYPKYKITKPIRLIEMFSGYGSQALALKYLGVPFEHWKICEWAVKSIQAYKDIHFTDKYYWKDVYDCTILKELLVDTLFSVGISSNYNEPMTKEQINRLSYEQLVRIYENILITNNLVNIQGIKGKDLEIVDTDKYEYIMTYSFPCQDLSLAGKKKGMSDTSTRSGMLWEVERILTECKELGTMPQILLMENVPQVHSLDNMPDFHKWQVRLEELGYKSYWQDLIATDYGIPQTRNRCFMISILGDYSYTFPKPIPLKLKLKDMLEDNVDEKYYLSDDLMQHIQKTAVYVGKNKEIKTCLLKNKGKEISRFTNNANTLMARDYKGFGNQEMNAVIERGKNNKSLIETISNNELTDGCYIDTYNKTINKEKSGTITTGVSFRNNTFLAIKNATKQGYLEATDGDGIDISSRMEYHRGTVQKGKTQTLTTMGGENNGVVVVDTLKRDLCNKLIQDGLVEEGDVVKHSYTQQIMDGNKKCVEKNDGNMITLTTRGDCVGVCVNDKPNYKDSLRIRKLTPRECFRLMGVKDEDFDKVKKNQSDASLYHLAGDSIVVNVLMAIFKELL